ncbi:hypothetical protein B0H14DRAFT_1031286 [Mycena olivaceomarginata]|nr:hypothetical protein B0H14DRAFT_1031286 [Mycena olivaceomarginata]
MRRDAPAGCLRLSMTFRRALDDRPRRRSRPTDKLKGARKQSHEAPPPRIRIPDWTLFLFIPHHIWLAERPLTTLFSLLYNTHSAHGRSAARHCHFPHIPAHQHQCTRIHLLVSLVFWFPAPLSYLYLCMQHMYITHLSHFGACTILRCDDTFLARSPSHFNSIQIYFTRTHKHGQI